MVTLHSGKTVDIRDLEKLIREEEKQKMTPNTPEELIRGQYDGENTLIHGLDMTARTRALYLYGEELGLSVIEYIEMAYAMLGRAAEAIEVYLQEEMDKTKERRDDHGIANNGVWLGGLTSVRLSLRAMVESPMEPDVWKSYASTKQSRVVVEDKAKLHSLEECLKNLKRLKKKKVISENEYGILRKQALGIA